MLSALLMRPSVSIKPIHINIMTIEYITFGVIDNLVMIIGAMTGYEVERYLPKALQKGLGAVVGAGLGNASSDWLGGFVAGNLGMANGTALGCIIGLGFIPAILLIKNLRKDK
jgi:hypothetical protein|tara:strand:+ start:309 stop:647 length:339 start_codon:yes stop_codon:yes gene_type:complete